MEKDDLLLKKLTEYGRTDAYPFHMPGHKRQVEMGITSFPNPFSVDITEINGFDNLHHPEGILKKSMERAAGVYGSDKTYYLVNGSTCGILSALCGAAGSGQRIAMARNSHKAAYHAVLLNRLEPVYLWPEVIADSGIQGGIRPEDVEAVLSGDSGIAAVFITSPTYEGIVSDVEAIAGIAHRYGVPLIVDEAHGAHFSFGEAGKSEFPKPALQCGADAVVQSLHKTLPSLTQTAVLHIRSRLLDSGRVERYLQIFQSSSPSYVLLSSIENCIFYMDREGRKRLAEYGAAMRRWMEECGELKYLRLLTDDVTGSFSVKDRDVSKIVVFDGRGVLTGTELERILRSRYHLEAEMSCARYVLLMTSLIDTADGLARLKDALFEIDAGMEGIGGAGNIGSAGEAGSAGDSQDAESVGNVKCIGNAPQDQECFNTWLQTPQAFLSPAEAAERPQETVALRDGAGRVSGGFITVYPPGIPALVPGEKITKEAVAFIESHIRAGLTVEGLAAEEPAAENLAAKEPAADGLAAGSPAETLKIRVVKE